MSKIKNEEKVIDKKWWEVLSNYQLEKLKEYCPNYKEMESPNLDIRWRLEDWSMEKAIQNGTLFTGFKNQEEVFEYIKHTGDYEYFKNAVKFSILNNEVSVKILYESLKYGYARAYRCISYMEECGFITKIIDSNHYKNNLTSEKFEEIFKEKFNEE